MSFFNKGFSLMPVRSFFNKASGGARSLFNKTPGAFRALSGGLGQASKVLGDASAAGNKLLSDPAVNKLAQQAGLGGLVGGARAGTGSLGSASALLGSASRITNPSSYAGQSPAGAASSAIEKVKSLGGQAKNLFV
jgi:hypothetical protein|tara:strand:- start:2561 stop:2968 length:408 start_codon:yes stop_codon:yes gene_type:complete